MESGASQFLRPVALLAASFIGAGAEAQDQTPPPARGICKPAVVEAKPPKISDDVSKDLRNISKPTIQGESIISSPKSKETFAEVLSYNGAAFLTEIRQKYCNSTGITADDPKTYSEILNATKVIIDGREDILAPASAKDLSKLIKHSAKYANRFDNPDEFIQVVNLFSNIVQDPSCNKPTKQSIIYRLDQWLSPNKLNPNQASTQINASINRWNVLMTEIPYLKTILATAIDPRIEKELHSPTPTSDKDSDEIKVIKELIAKISKLGNDQIKDGNPIDTYLLTEVVLKVIADLRANKANASDYQTTITNDSLKLNEPNWLRLNLAIFARIIEIRDEANQAEEYDKANTRRPRTIATPKAQPIPKPASNPNPNTTNP